MCYVHHTKHWRMVGWVGDPMDDVRLALYADADFAGCVESLRSTPGGHLIELTMAQYSVSVVRQFEASELC